MTPATARGALLALAAARVDTCGFIGLFGLFTAHVTGNFVLIGADVVNRHVDILTKSLALPVFIVSVAVANQAEVALRRRAMNAARWLLGAEAVLIAVAALAPRWAGLPQQPDDLASIAIGFLLIAAVGVQNALMRTSLGGPVQTTVMTGNVTQHPRPAGPCHRPRRCRLANARRGDGAGRRRVRTRLGAGRGGLCVAALRLLVARLRAGRRGSVDDAGSQRDEPVICHLRDAVTTAAS